MKKVLVRMRQIFEYNLIELRRCLLQPKGLRLCLPDGKPFTHIVMIDELLALLVIGDLECEGLVPDEAAGASDTTHSALLFTVWFNPKFVGLQAFHPLNYICTIKAIHKIIRVKIVLVRYKYTWALQQKLVL